VRTRLVLLSAAASGALALGCVLTAAPATAAPVSTECLNAQTQLNTDRITLQNAKNQLASDRATGALNSTILADQAAVSQAQAQVNVDQTAVNIQCGTTGGTGTGNGFPRPRPVPVPVGTGFLNCTQLAARGLHDIPAGNPFYRTALDGNHDGVACETTIPVGTFRVVNGQNCHWNGTTWVPVTVVAPPPAADPCNCTPAPAPQPAQVIVQPAPQVTQTVVEQPPVVVPPAQVFTNPVAPSIAATSTGDGTMAGQH
jgi:hypothetical protein